MSYFDDVYAAALALRSGDPALIAAVREVHEERQRPYRVDAPRGADWTPWPTRSPRRSGEDVAAWCARLDREDRARWLRLEALR